MIRQVLPTARPLDGPAELEGVYLQPSHHLRVNFVASLDGAIEIQGRSGGLGRPADRAVFMAMRAVADAVLVGAGTVRDEDYGPVRMSEEVIARRRTRGQRDIPELAIVSSQAGLRPDAKVFSGAGRPLLLTSEMACARRPDLASQAEMIPCGEIRVELPVALAALADRGLGRLVCEGGPTLFRSLLIADLVDELCLTHAPVLTGSPHRHLTGDAPLGEPLRLTLTGLLEGDGLLLARYAKPEKLFGGGDT